MQVLHYARRSITRWSTSRLFSSTATLHLDPNHSIYVSNPTNPYFNLSLEDWSVHHSCKYAYPKCKYSLHRRLFRHKSHTEPLLLLYRDNPCVVIGRNQNPWKEVNLPASHRTGIPFIRRRSGGGTVYHVRRSIEPHICPNSDRNVSRTLEIPTSPYICREHPLTDTQPRR